MTSGYFSEVSEYFVTVYSKISTVLFRLEYLCLNVSEIFSNLICSCEKAVTWLCEIQISSMI